MEFQPENEINKKFQESVQAVTSSKVVKEQCTNCDKQ